MCIRDSQIVHRFAQPRIVAFQRGVFLLPGKEAAAHRGDLVVGLVHLCAQRGSLCHRVLRTFFLVLQLVEYPVSYTHLDVYKRQGSCSCQTALPFYQKEFLFIA